MSFLEIIKAMLGLLPLIMQSVAVVEAAVPQAGAGAQKLATVLSTVQAATTILPGVITASDGMQVAVKAGDSTAIGNGLAHMINAVVALFNATGAFQKSGLVQAINEANKTPNF